MSKEIYSLIVFPCLDLIEVTLLGGKRSSQRGWQASGSSYLLQEEAPFTEQFNSNYTDIIITQSVAWWSLRCEHSIHHIWSNIWLVNYAGKMCCCYLDLELYWKVNAGFNFLIEIFGNSGVLLLTSFLFFYFGPFLHPLTAFYLVSLRSALIMVSLTSEVPKLCLIGLLT